MSTSPPPVPNHTSGAIDSHEMQQRNGFQKLHSVDNTPTGTPLEQQTNREYFPQQDNRYYSPPPPPLPGQPQYYYGGPPMGQQYTLLEPQAPPAAILPYGHNRHPLLRLLIGPINTPIFSYLSAIAMAGVLIYEFVKFHQLTGSVVETNPFNPMIGPSFQVKSIKKEIKNLHSYYYTQALVNVGARFTPCIRPVPSFPSTTRISNCYQSLTDTCTVEELCGFGGFPNGIPNQSFRLVIPIFMHAGVIHFLMNMLTHLRLGVDLERALGTPRYVILYMASGIWGFVLSAMLSQNLSASTGCSGALFGLIGYMFIDVLVNWKILPHPVRDLMSLLISTIISLILGLLPGLDNFAHIGGFVVGILLGMTVAPMRPMATTRVKVITWILRVVALVALIVLFAVSIHQFYAAYDPSTICPNCKYLSCLPVNNWCDPVN